MFARKKPGPSRATARRAAAVGMLVMLSLHAGTAAGSPSSDIETSRAEFERISRDISLSAEKRASLAAEIAALGKDHVTITAALIQSAKTEKKLAADIDEIALRLDGLKEEESALRNSLAARRGVLAEVLGALQRMGLNPPPAILVQPEDALSSVRSAILLGAVVPELRAETEILVADLRELDRILVSIEAERSKLAAAAEEQVAEKARLALLIEEKKRLRGEAEEELAREQARAAELAEKSRSLKDLIAALETEAEKKRLSEEKRLRAEEQKRERLAARGAQTPEENRLGAAPPFSALQRQIPLPVAGRLKRRFGQQDGNGGVMLGDTLATQSGAIVTSPAEGSVLYAGPFRSYGQLLILDAGDGYHVVLAGMDRISVAAGQSVMSGEPVGAMGEARLASIAAASGEDSGAELYVEFRKQGKPVDPGPWWAERRSGRTGNDS